MKIPKMKDGIMETNQMVRIDIGMLLCQVFPCFNQLLSVFEETKGHNERMSGAKCKLSQKSQCLRNV